MRTAEGGLTTGQRILDQVIDVVEGHFMNPREDLEHAGRFIFEKYHEGSFDGWTACFDAGNFLDDDGSIGRKFQDRLNPITDLVKDETRDIHFATERIDFGGTVSVSSDKTILKSLSDFFAI